MFIFISVVALILVFFLLRFFSVPKFGNLILVSGAVKAGKSTFSFRLAEKRYKKQLFRYYVRRYVIFPVVWFFSKNRSQLRVPEKPLFYSNIPCAVKNFSPLTEDILLRKKRLRYGSVIYVDEASLVADSQLIKNMTINERLMLWNKLIGHETKGGYLVYNSQAIGDLHYSIKRCVGTYFYVHHKVRLPFFVILYYREMFFSDDTGSSAHVSTTGADEKLKRLLVPVSTWKKFDCYCYSSFTDDLPVSDEVIVIQKKDKKKVHDLVSFRYFTTIPKEYQKDEKSSDQN